MNTECFFDDMQKLNESAFLDKWGNDPTLAKLVNIRIGTLSPLEKAIDRDWPYVIDILVKNGADVNDCDIYGKNALAYACLWRKYDLVKKLIDYGSDMTVNIFRMLNKDDNKTIEMFINNGCSIHTKNEYNKTLISVAINNSGWNKSLIKFLFAKQIETVSTIFYTLPQYIILWITDWLEGSEYLLEYQKIKIIEGVQQSINRIKERHYQNEIDPYR